MLLRNNLKVVSRVNIEDYIFIPEDLEEALTIIEHLKTTIRLKDKKMKIDSKKLENLENERKLLYERIKKLKELLNNAGFDVV